MIIATAGHVDHGKTLLVKALTGIDADRFPEEKKRGMTIDLGFAYWRPESDSTIGFVDVPGHHRFIHNMLCGVTGIDSVLLVVAADDGIMPQTREHVAIIDLLGIRRGMVAVTKADRVAPDRAAEVAREIVVLLAGTGLANAPTHIVSATTGAGIDKLKADLIAAARNTPNAAAQGCFRLAIDRSFTIAGAGLVVTGTVFSGSVSVGDRVKISAANRDARVRSIHSQNAEAQSGHAGERCALNLAGSDLGVDLVQRGDWIVSLGVPVPVAKLDVRLRVLGSEARPLAHWTPVHVHLGSAGTTGRVALLEGGSISPGEAALVQLALNRPLGAVRGDRLILRDQSAQRTIGGGYVIDIFPPSRGRAKPQRLAYLQAMEHDDDPAALAALLEDAMEGVDLDIFAANRNLTRYEADTLFAAQNMRIVTTATSRFGFAVARWDHLKAVTLEALAAWHRRSPGVIGLSEDRLLSATAFHLPREAVLAVAAELVADGAIVREATGMRLPSHQSTLSTADTSVWQRVEPLLDQTPTRPPSVHEMAASLGTDVKKLEALLVRATRLGLLIRVAPNRFFRPAVLRQLEETAAALAAEEPGGGVTAAALRDRCGIGRNLAIELLEYFDRVKFTRRRGDAHEVIRPLEQAFGTNRR
jgi:selenocysteine-specific elongation factor